MNIFIKRLYEDPDPKDGLRILVDRLWPRGLSREKAKVDVWIKAVAPSNDLRKWYRHDADKWAEFMQRYFAELDAGKEVLDELLLHIQKGYATFLYSAKETEHNKAAALKEYISSLLP